MGDKGLSEADSVCLHANSQCEVKFAVSEEALRWFKEEWGFRSGDVVRIVVRYGGSDGFMLGLRKDETMREPAMSLSTGNITFFISKDDAWFLGDKSLFVDYDKEDDDIVFKMVDVYNHNEAE